MKAKPTENSVANIVAVLSSTGHNVFLKDATSPGTYRINEDGSVTALPNTQFLEMCQPGSGRVFIRKGEAMKNRVLM